MSTVLWNGQTYAQTNDKLTLKENANYRIVDGSCIARILPNTSVEQFKSQLSNTNVTIYKDQAKKEKITSGIVKTGMVVTDGVTSYTISVIGDVNKDGLLNQVDIREMIQIIIGTKAQDASVVSKKAFDVNDDEATDQRDLTKMIQYVIYGKMGVKEENANPNKEEDNKPQNPEPVIDQTAPTMSEVQFSTTGWTNGTVTITGSARDEQSGIVAYQATLNATPDANNWKTITKTTANLPLIMQVSENGTYYWFIKDATGNVAMKKIEVNNIDTQAPNLTVTIGEVTTQGVQIQVEASDAQSGIVERKYALGNQNATYFATAGSTFSGNSVMVSVDGTYTFYVKDNAGNVTLKNIQATKKANPQKFSISKIEGAQTNLAFIKGETTEFTIIPGRNGKIDTSKIKVSGAERYDTQVTSDGKVIVRLTVGDSTGEMNVSIGEGLITDNDGNYSQAISVGPFHVDNSGPKITSFATANIKDNSIRVTVKATDVGKSGLASKETYTYYISRNSNFSNATTKVTTDTEYTFTGLEAGQKYYFKVVAKDNNGNTTTSQTINATTSGTTADLNAIFFSNNIAWNDGVASITLYKEDSNLYMQYMITDRYGRTLKDWREVTENRYTIRNLENDVIVKARLADKNGNVGKYVTLHVIDNVSPEAGTVRMTSTGVGTTYRVYDGDTVNSSVLVKLYDGSDAESGHKRTRYTITGPENIYNATEDALLTENGTYKIVVTTEDNVGNTATRTYRITINIKSSDNNNNDTNNRLIVKATSPSGPKYINRGGSYTFTLKANRPVTAIDIGSHVYIKTGVSYRYDLYATDSTKTNWALKVTVTKGTGTMDVSVLPGLFIDNYGNLNTQEIVFPRVWVE